MILLIDNYDSFVFNVAQALGALGADVRVFRNDAIRPGEALAMAPRGLVISPGPGSPAEAGVSKELIRRFAGLIPVLGICLGHQCIAEAFGGSIVPARALVHGKTSRIHHDGAGLFAGLPNPFEAGRYHSLAVSEATLPGALEVCAQTVDGEIMGLRHGTHPVEGVQFHPESILTAHGIRFFRNFLDGTRSPRPGIGARPGGARVPLAKGPEAPGPRFPASGRDGNSWEAGFPMERESSTHEEKGGDR